MSASLVSVLTLFSMTKIWGGVFWGEPQTGDDAAPFDPPRAVPLLMTGATAALVAVTLVIAVAGGAVWDLSVTAGQQLFDGDAYTAAVRGGDS